jgi:hypothetical protein
MLAEYCTHARAFKVQEIYDGTATNCTVGVRAFHDDEGSSVSRARRASLEQPSSWVIIKDESGLAFQKGNRDDPLWLNKLLYSYF